MTDAELLSALSEIAPRTARQITGRPAPQSIRCVDRQLTYLRDRGLVYRETLYPDHRWLLTPEGREARDGEK